MTQLVQGPTQHGPASHPPGTVSIRTRVTTTLLTALLVYELGVLGLVLFLFVAVAVCGGMSA